MESFCLEAYPKGGGTCQDMVFFEPFISPNSPSQDDYLPPSFEFLFTSYGLMTSQSSQTDVIANDKDGYMCATWGRLNMGKTKHGSII